MNDGLIGAFKGVILRYLIEQICYICGFRKRSKFRNGLELKISDANDIFLFIKKKNVVFFCLRENLMKRKTKRRRDTTVLNAFFIHKHKYLDFRCFFDTVLVETWLRSVFC